MSKPVGLHIIMLTTTSGLHSILPTTHTARREGPYHAFNPLSPNIHIQILQTDLYIFP